MATIIERQPGVYFARVFLPPSAAGEKGRQVGKVFRGGKKAVRADVAEWEASPRGTAPGTVGATVAVGFWPFADTIGGSRWPGNAAARRSRDEPGR